MKKFAILSIAIALLVVAATAVSQSQEAPDEPKLTPEQAWLKQLVGEWDVDYTAYMEQDQPPVEAAGTDSVRAIGDHWVIAETKFTMKGASYSGALSVGYDARKKQFNATWIDSMSGHLWVYEGTLNEARDTLTLMTEGPSMRNPNATARYKEIITIKGKDHRTFSSSIETEDGGWTTILEADYRRKK